MIKLVIPGRPVPKRRPRWAKQGMRVYTPRETAEYEKQIGYLALRETKGKDLFGKRDIAIDIKLFFRDKKFGDIDNYSKAILDGLQGVIYGNDKQVAKLSVERIVDENERAEIEIREVS